MFVCVCMFCCCFHLCEFDVSRRFASAQERNKLIVVGCPFILAGAVCAHTIKFKTKIII